ncbi:3-hydroxyacyl-CoA dehydrogenase NAD-binding domain-containing protein [Nevskia sp.]|uniref:3-hydroxyacyl-CoA dehydrogenase NAD-binding domain-containing protein n=1 Tax=Nevskia sp. TaxID=1929292 RepID=UPI0025FE5B1B|nr:3-hydroxyacyl-CoA dehydrogenase NAD-binding domain-containing protein [Nevskia sp.]
MATIDETFDSNVAYLTINNPPVNALATAIRAGLVAAIRKAAENPAVKAIVIIGADKTFVAGADIRELGKPLQRPFFPDVLAAIEALTKPVIAALHGNALGGGLELALACHYRVALASVKVGLPEVTLGLLPGAGGTQRLPRLVGPAKALDMILSGKPVDGRAALLLGIVDELAEGTTGADLLQGAQTFAHKMLAERRRATLVSARQDKVSAVDPALFEDIRSKNAAKWRGQLAQESIVACVEAACTLPFAEGMAFERERFFALKDSSQCKAMRHVFFAEREASKVPGLPADVKARSVRSVAIIGAGTMGGGIAMAFANAGIPVTQIELGAEALANGRAIIENNYATSVARGSMSRDKAAKALTLIKGGTNYADIADCDLVVEAVFESMDIKKAIFRKLDAVMKPGAILATNTSTLDIDEIAAATKRPEAVIGTHFFSPANVMKLQENVRGAHSSAETIASVMSLAKKIGKIPVLSGNCEGFIGNRMLYNYVRECDFLLEEGATPWQVDNALKAFGFPMGVYLMRDLAGLDVSWRVRKGREATRDMSERYSPIADRICELGRFGQKTGAGYYRYDGRTASPDPKIEALIESVSRDQGRTRKPVSDEDIVMRALCALVNEGAKILEEGIASRAGDIDVIYVNGYGFPRYRGGPMFFAEHEGLATIHAHIQRLYLEQGQLWKPAPLLARLAKSGEGWSAGAASPGSPGRNTGVHQAIVKQ